MRSSSLCYALLLLHSSSSNADPRPAQQVVQVSVSDSEPARPLVRFGFGNELVWQSANDSKLNRAVSASGSTIARYPGGTPADYWEWKSGWVNTSTDQSGSAHLPVRPAPPAAWKKYLTECGYNATATVQRVAQESIFVVNQLQSSVEHQISGLKAFEEQGIPITRIELGNGE